MKISGREGRRRYRFSTRMIGPKRAALLAAMVAALIALSSTPALAATALMIGGIGQSTLSDDTMRMCLDRKFTGVDPVSGTPWQRVSVYWPAPGMLGVRDLGPSVAEGTANLVQAIKTAYNSSPDDPITVIGISAGTIVMDEAMRQLANDPTAPPPSAIKFVELGSGSQKHAGSAPIDPRWNPFSDLFGYTFKPPPVTPYDLTVVTYEYDGWADFPDRWWNRLAVANATAGALILHPATWVVDLSTVPAANITYKTNASGGITTTYLVESETLPLVMLRPRLARKEDELRQRIEAGYSRNDPQPGGSSLASPLTAVPALAPNGQSAASMIDPPAGAAANPVEERAPSRQRLANVRAPRTNAMSAPVRPIRALINGFRGTANASAGVEKAAPQADSVESVSAPASDSVTTSVHGPADKLREPTGARDRQTSTASRPGANRDGTPGGRGAHRSAERAGTRS